MNVDVSQIMKTPFYTLIIDHITKPHNFNVEDILIRHIKLFCWKCVTPWYCSLKYSKKSVNTYSVNLGHLTCSNRINFFIKSCYKCYLDQHDVPLAKIAPQPLDPQPPPPFFLYKWRKFTGKLHNENIILWSMTF